MKLTPLLTLLAAALPASAIVRPPSGVAPAEKSPPSVDPAALSPQARAAYQADPDGFLKEHADAIAAQQRWSQDPALGQEECLQAKRDPRACMEQRVGQMAEIYKPAQYATINAFVKLLPRGVSAATPDASGLGGAAKAPDGVAAGSPAGSPAPPAAGAPHAAPGAHFNAPPAAAPPAAAPPAEAPGMVDAWVDVWCQYMGGCGKKT